VEFELVWMDKLLATNPDMLVVDCSKGIELHEMDEGDEHEHEEEEEPHEDEHEYNEEEEHHHEGADPHIWMSPANAAIMVRNIGDGLITADPDNESFYRQNRDAYLQQLEEIDREIRDSLAGVENRRLMVYHPAFGYLAREYGLTMISIEKEGKEPTASGLTDLIEQAKAHDIRVIFAEPQFDPKSAEVIAKAIGGKVVLIDALAEDYIGNLRLIMNEILLALE
jgi:zinc transport system substrate-binding protein